jgi:hypothetical protein
MTRNSSTQVSRGLSIKKYSLSEIIETFETETGELGQVVENVVVNSSVRRPSMSGHWRKFIFY